MAPSPRRFFHDAIHAATILHSFFCATLLRGLCCVVMVTVMVMGGGAYALDVPGTHLSAYTISGVRVDATAETVAAAREAALNQGKQHAFYLLASRLGVLTEHVPDLDSEALSRLVLGVTIQHEGRSSIRYTGKIAVTFFPEAIRDVFDSVNVRIFDTLAPAQLILPIWTPSLEENPTLWGDENPWRLAWTSRLKTGLVPIEVPLGDLQDVEAVRLAQAFALEQTPLLDLAHRYHADDAVVTHAHPLWAEGASSGTGPYAVRVTAARRKDGGFLFNETIPLEGDVKEGERLTEALNQAAEHVVAWLDARWREDYVVSSPGDRGTTFSLYVDIPAGLEDWVTVQRTLDKVHSVQSWSLVSLRPTDAWISATVRGSPKQLVPDFASAGFYMDEADGHWVVRPGLLSEMPPSGE